MNRSRVVAQALRVLVALAALGFGVSAQKLHTDERLGFQFKPPKDYKSVALSPTEFLVVAKYQASATDSSGDAGGKGFHRLFELSFFPSGFTSGPAEPGEEQPATPTDRFQKMIEDQYANHQMTDSRELSISGSKARELRYTSDTEPIAVYCVIVEQSDGVFVFEGAALAQRFKDAVGDFSKAVRTFKRVEKADRTEREAELAEMGEQDRFLQLQIEKLPPGWKHLRTPRYLFLYNAEGGLVKQLAERIEVMRDEYERLYPPDKPIEAVSIVRVCNSPEEYFAYGGPQGSGGYWNYVERELVFFDYRPREVPLLVLNHEAFHQFIYYFYGQLAPHSWYNEGHGDYFAGAKLTRSNRITEYGAQPAAEFNRLPGIKEGARLLSEGKGAKDGAAVPLKQLMAFHKSDYYGSKGYDPGLCYAEGWAVVHMLREAKGQDEKWKQILPSYLEHLLAARHQIATELMEKDIKQWEKLKAEFDSGGENAPAEMPKEPSRDPKDYYLEASSAKTDAVQDLAYERTFGDWTEEDWDEFQEFFLKYVETL
jgi:hypothetical protein